MSSDVVASICGTCLSNISASHVPTCCFKCGARYERGPYALVRIDIVATPCAGTVHVEPRFEIDYVGPWDITARAAINESFGEGVTKEQEHV